MNEQDFFNEKQELKKATYSCPHCRERAEYDVRWLRRTKKQGPPRGANEQDRLRYQKSRDYMVRIDDMLACKSCRRRFDIPSSQSYPLFPKLDVAKMLLLKGDGGLCGSSV